MQIRFQKRASHYISFEGNYTFSKSTDDSSAGRNAWLGNLQYDNPQLLDDLKAEHSISSNDTPHRLTAAIIFDLPFGRDRWIGRGMNPVLDAFVGGWALNNVLTLQSGQPLTVYNSAGLLVDGNQRPNVLCPQISTGLSYRDAAKSGGSVINQDCFGDPGDNIAGNSPRYFSNLRGDGIHNLDTSLSKEFKIRENKLLQVRAEMFNAFNHQRFAFPDLGSGDGALGHGHVHDQQLPQNAVRSAFPVLRRNRGVDLLVCPAKRKRQTHPELQGQMLWQGCAHDDGSLTLRPDCIWARKIRWVAFPPRHKCILQNTDREVP